MRPNPVLLIEGGRFRRRNMRHELVTEEELMSELRKRGVHDLADVESVQMESDGEISVVPKEKGAHQSRSPTMISYQPPGRARPGLGR